MNITNCILRPVLRCTGLTVLWIAISASAQVAPGYDAKAGSAGRIMIGHGLMRRLPIQDSQASASGSADAQALDNASAPTPVQSALTITYGALDYPHVLGSAPTGINSKGQIVGCVATPQTGPIVGYRLNGTSFSKIAYPGPYTDCPGAINNSGEIVGDYSSDGYKTAHSFFLVGKVFTPLPDYPGSISTQAFGVDAFGAIVGPYSDVSNHVHGFVYRKGVYSSIDVPSAKDTFLNATSSNGNILAGSYNGSDGHEHGFLFQNNVFTTVDYPGAVDTVINGVNDLGDYVGAWGNGTPIFGNSEYNGFLFSGGSYVSVNLPWAGVSVTQVFTINNKKQMVGAYVDANRILSGFDAAAK